MGLTFQLRENLRLASFRSRPWNKNMDTTGLLQRWCGEGQENREEKEDYESVLKSWYCYGQLGLSVAQDLWYISQSPSQSHPTQVSINLQAASWKLQEGKLGALTCALVQAECAPGREDRGLGSQGQEGSLGKRDNWRETTFSCKGTDSTPLGTKKPTEM